MSSDEKSEVHERPWIFYHLLLQIVSLMGSEVAESENYVFESVFDHQLSVVEALSLQLMSPEYIFSLMMMKEMNCLILKVKECPKTRYPEMVHYYTNQLIA